MDIISTTMQLPYHTFQVTAPHLKIVYQKISSTEINFNDE